MDNVDMDVGQSRQSGAHPAAAHRAQADALLIESRAKRCLADEYDAAQERGEIARQGQRTELFQIGKAFDARRCVSGAGRRVVDRKPSEAPVGR
jgi:methyl coenzyme M reductase alpha subunit